MVIIRLKVNAKKFIANWLRIYFKTRLKSLTWTIISAFVVYVCRKAASNWYKTVNDVIAR
jgi:hypothetical protein